MKKRVYISADYAEETGDREVVEVLHTWGNDDKHIVEYVDTASVVSGSVSSNPDCRPCDLKEEFNKQINASSVVIFVIGDKTSTRTAGSVCKRGKEGFSCNCTPYKHNTNGTKKCKFFGVVNKTDSDGNINKVNEFSYLKHEFMQAVQKGKIIIILYNSLKKQPRWLPSYMSGYEDSAEPFWIESISGNRIGNYEMLKKALGYE